MSIAGLNSLGTLLTGVRLPSPAAPAAPTHGGPRTEPNALVGRLLERAIGAPNDPNATGVGRWLDVRAKQVSVSEDTSLTIRTAEGDTVTLTSHTEMESLKARLTYGPGDAPDADEHGDDDGVEGATSVRLRELRLDRSVTLSVQGDLSDEELADIRELVERLGDTLHDAGHDDDHAGTRSLVRLSTEGFDSLAGFELHAERTVEVTRVHVRRLAPPTPSGTNPPAPSQPAPRPSGTASPLVGSEDANAPNPLPSRPEAGPAWSLALLRTDSRSTLDLWFARPAGAMAQSV